MTEIVPATPGEASESLPPFDGLTALQSAFVRCYVQNGDGNATRAARDAGYSESSAAAVGYRLLRRDEVLSAIDAETRRAIGPMMPVALATMVRLLNHKSGFVQHQAAADLLDRGGFRPPERHQHAVVGKVEVDIRLTDD
jgi:phage terminase small subunit